jgi:predicted nucleic acid-binding protein
MTYMLDTSVLTRLRVDAVRQRVTALDGEGLACTSLTLLELGFSARNADEWDALAKAVGVFGTVAIAEEHVREAARTQRQLAAQGLRGRKVPDLIIAAAARSRGLTVLHYDRDFEHIAAVTGQPHEWVVPAGTVD